jgi:DNA-binding XRE family transcriptional regulator
MNNKRTQKRAVICRRPRPDGSQHLLDILNEAPLPLSPTESSPDPYAFDDYEFADYQPATQSSELLPVLASADDAQSFVDCVHSQDLTLCNRESLRRVFNIPSFRRMRQGNEEWSGAFRLSLRWPGRWPLPFVPEVVRKEIDLSGRDVLSATEFSMTALTYPTQQHKRQLVNLGRSLRAIREEQRLSGQQLAVRAGVPHWRVTAIEEGRLDPDFETLLRLAEAMSISAAALFDAAEALDKEDER